MPWTCRVCRTEYFAAYNILGLACFKTPECKAKKHFACDWSEPEAEAEELTEVEQADALGYPDRYNSSGDSFPAKHSTKVMFVNLARSRGISSAGSTHSGGRSGWKGFNSTPKGWSYVGSFQMNLQPWDFRVNDARAPFPRGDA
jgi:hypothetical protein